MLLSSISVLFWLPVLQFLKIAYLFIFGCAGSSLLCGLSLDVVTRGYSLLAVCKLLIAGASHVAMCRSQSMQATVFVVHRLSCPPTCGIVPDQGLNPCPPH